jgi:formylglycine-generating enzyme required for sulfatase activity
MSSEPPVDEDREQRLEGVLHSYLVAVDAGQAPDPEKVMATDLANFFADQGQLLVASGLLGLLAIVLAWGAFLSYRVHSEAELITPSSSPPAPSALDLAVRVEQILRASCHRCHGQDGNVEGGFNYVLDRHQLVARRMIVPGEPEKSRLLRRVHRGEMPPEGEIPRPAKDEIALVRRWIEEGAPAFSPPAPQRDFISPQAMLQYIQEDLTRARETDRELRRYFSITHLYNTGLPEDGLQTYRHGLAKLVNSLSWRRDIVAPVAIDPARTIFRIDLRDYQWSRKVWEAILATYPYGIVYSTETARFCLAATHCWVPYVRADWFVFAASRPPLYHQILQLPDTAEKMETQLRVDVEENLRQFHAARAGFNGSGISANNRLIERHESMHGAYWKSYDFAAPEGANGNLRDLFQHPLGPAPERNAFRHDGGEILFNLPNGLQGYMLVNGSGKRIDKAPTDIVKDARQRDGAVVNGISCMSCHVKGIIPRDDQIRQHVEKSPGAFSGAEKVRVLAFYPPRDRFRDLLRKDAERFAAAVKETGAHLSATDPIVALAQRYEWELDLRLAAAEVGLTSEEFTHKLSQSPRLIRLFGSLRLEGGTIQREKLVASFGNLVRELELGDFQSQERSDLALTDSDALLENSLGMKLRRIPAGTFVMGSPPTERGRSLEEKQHEVDITRPFYLGIFEVTQEEYRKVTGKSPSHFSSTGGGSGLVKGLDTRRHPVEGISWEDARRFCKQLSELPDERKRKRVYRLPTEAEWEYACRAGTDTAYSFGSSATELGDYAWYAGTSGGMTHPVGQKKPNAWGLYDMHGNVAEWCADPYSEEYYEHSPRKDPRGPDTQPVPPLRVLRGGSWQDGAGDARSAGRHHSLPSFSQGANRYGLRIVLEIP